MRIDALFVLQNNVTTDQRQKILDADVAATRLREVVRRLESLRKHYGENWLTPDGLSSLLIDMFNQISMNGSTESHADLAYYLGFLSALFYTKSLDYAHIEAMIQNIF